MKKEPSKRGNVPLYGEIIGDKPRRCPVCKKKEYWQSGDFVLMFKCKNCGHTGMF